MGQKKLTEIHHRFNDLRTLFYYVRAIFHLYPRFEIYAARHKEINAAEKQDFFYKSYNLAWHPYLDQGFPFSIKDRIS
jgi:hypothetical protein